MNRDKFHKIRQHQSLDTKVSRHCYHATVLQWHMSISDSNDSHQGDVQCQCKENYPSPARCAGLNLNLKKAYISFTYHIYEDDNR